MQIIEDLITIGEYIKYVLEIAGTPIILIILLEVMRHSKHV